MKTQLLFGWILWRFCDFLWASGGWRKASPHSATLHLHCLPLWCLCRPAPSHAKITARAAVRGAATPGLDVTEDPESRLLFLPPWFSVAYSRSAGGSVQTCENPGCCRPTSTDFQFVPVCCEKAAGLSWVTCNLAKWMIQWRCSGLVKTHFVFRVKIFQSWNKLGV